MNLQLKNDFSWPVKANEPVSLGKRKVLLRIASKQASGSVIVSLKMLPRPRVVFEGESSDSAFNPIDLRDLTDASLTIKPENKKTNVIVTSAQFGETFNFTLAPQREIVEVGKKVSVAYVRAALINFLDCYTKAAHGLVQRQVQLDSEEWSIAIKAQPSAGEIVRDLENEGGYGVTHEIKINKSDGSAIDIRSARNILEALKYFFSFARGAHCPPGLVSGIGGNSESKWHEWGFPTTSRWSTTHNWFSSPQGEALRGIFPGFIGKWQSGWRHHLTSAMYMYAEANRDEPDVTPSLMLAQATLELLSWVVLVEDSRALSADGFRHLPASDQIRLLLHEFQVPTELPSLLPELTKAARHQELDGPGMLAEVRNSLVHPGKKPSGGVTIYVLTQAWELSMWYIELVLLHIFGYRGNYVNRLKVCGGIDPVIESVPWAKT